jgi:hypothetical protein
MLAEGADVFFSHLAAAYSKHSYVSPSQHFALNDMFKVGTVQKYATKCSSAVLGEEK